ncbi:MAG TPA: Hsp20/alpha crystallin family protein [Ktedonobacterales bacterium]|nr:Hsp20/alpha crystallin family protein [Ktedonobacterales bacterium]
MFEMSRWNPFEEMMSLREAMNRLMEESFLMPSRAWGTVGTETGQVTTHGGRQQIGAPAVDIQDQDDAFTMRVTLPGVRPDDVNLEIRGNQVVINGQVREEQEREHGNYLLRERRVGQFYRTFTLPSEVNADQAEATYANGILTLRLPKSEARRARQIPIRAGDERQRLESGQTQMPGQAPGQAQRQASWQGQGQPQTPGQGQYQTPGQGQYQTPGQGQSQYQAPGQGQERSPQQG